MIDRRNFIFLSTAALAAACTRVGAVSMPANTRLIILRHADRNGDDLSRLGRARAAGLAGALQDIEIDAIYSFKIPRNLDTAAPLAKDRGLPIRSMISENPSRILMSEGAGKTIVWVGNKGNLANIWESLGAPGPAPLEYGDVFIVEPGPSGPPSVIRRSYEP